TVFNTVFDGKLRAEAWINETLLAAKSPAALSAIRQREPLDVSVGVFTDEIEQTGEYNGEQYIAIAENHRPDHLALLPGCEGACSWADGCGIRVNKKKKEVNEDMQVNEKVKKDYVNLLIQSMGFREIGNQIQHLLDEMDTEGIYHYLEEVYSTYFIYRKEGRDGTMYFKRSYTTENDVKVTFTTEPVEVVRELNYININQKKNNMAKETQCPECVEALITNKQTNFTENDREWLLTQSKEVLDKLIPKPVPAVNAQQTITKEAAINVLKQTIKTPKDFVALLPDTLQDQMTSALSVHQRQREYLVKSILDNTKDVWTEDDLTKMNTNMLERVAKSVNVKKENVIDYSALGQVTNNTAEFTVDDFLAPAGIEFNKTK
ncbi:MAG: hypothetical protein B6I31_05545, partial [Desulfobacteraceae bacterium 4572_19]